MKKLTNNAWFYLVLGYLVLFSRKIFIPESHPWYHGYPALILIINISTMILSFPIFYLSIKMAKEKAKTNPLPYKLKKGLFYLFLFLFFSLILNLLLILVLS
ncbi:hypothetical protein SAMN05720591_10499 [Halolactibacillus alkaliphilus]|nr:hypothetical protein SAMN05720591_10499 [Halolactibacillus alkaliphilus]